EGDSACGILWQKPESSLSLSSVWSGGGHFPRWGRRIIRFPSPLPAHSFSSPPVCSVPGQAGRRFCRYFPVGRTDAPSRLQFLLIVSVILQQQVAVSPVFLDFDPQ